MNSVGALDRKRCFSCRSCFLSCPKGAIEMVEDQEGFLYPEVGPKCAGCGICVARCPAASPLARENTFVQRCFAMTNKNRRILMSSASGGLFYQLAHKIIEDSGAVFGAAYDEKMNVRHICANNFEELERLQGSKYVFCDTGSSFFLAKKELESGKKVLYSGSPCQIAGLYSYLEKSGTENLITVDLICHGTPSSKLFHKYLEYLEEKEGSRIVSYSFRDKSAHPLGAIKYTTANGKSYVEKYNLCDPYGAAFSRHENYKMSCYTCPFASLERIGDLTIGDFWGIDNILPDFPNTNGVSACLVNSEKGFRLLNSVKDCFFCSELSATDCAKHNPWLRKPEGLPKTRVKFYENIDSVPPLEFMAKIKRKNEFLFVLRNFLLRVIGKTKKLFTGVRDMRQEKRICVISSFAYIRNNNNYGALLQYYAVEKFLKNMGYKAFWLRFVLPHSNLFYYLLHLLRRECRPSLFVREILCHRCFMRFCRRRINCTKKIFKTDKEIEKNIPSADFYITGSDQVWGGILKPNFLCFVHDKKKKIAFAVSFGRKEFSEEQIESGVPEWIKDFNSISVRETEGVRICGSLGIDAVNLLDPTFLLDAHDYLDFNLKCKSERRYVQCYFLNVEDRDDVSFAAIEEFSRDKQLRLKVTGAGDSGMKFPKEYYFYPSPERWLYSYKNAEYIITNTFHGTVFAIIFRKQFATILQKGKMERLNSRIYSLLRRFDLESRILDGDTNLGRLLDTPVNWKTAEAETERNRYEAKIFLQKAGL